MASAAPAPGEPAGGRDPPAAPPAAEHDGHDAGSAAGTRKKRSFGAISDGGGTAAHGAAAAANPTAGAADAGLALAKMSSSIAACRAGPPPCARTCRIVETDSICLDANLSDDFKWPTDKMRSKGGLSEWPLWGWLGALQGRTGKVVYIWDRKPKDGKDKAALVPKKCCKGSRQAGFRLKDAASDAMEKIMLLLEIDQHYVPILEEVFAMCVLMSERGGYSSAGMGQRDPPATWARNKGIYLRAGVCVRLSVCRNIASSAPGCSHREFC